jgi:hypothetical protein
MLQGELHDKIEASPNPPKEGLKVTDNLDIGY